MQNIIFLFTGQSRDSPFSNNTTKSTAFILDSYKKYIFTEEFKLGYNYKVYISSDNLDLEKTTSYFSSDKIGNIHLWDNDFFMKDINNKTKDESVYLDKYKMQDWSYYQQYNNSIGQFHKILDCYNLFLEDETSKDINWDYIIRIRLDMIIPVSIQSLILYMNENKSFEICAIHDFFAVGKPEIMHCYCKGLDNNYGSYAYYTDISTYNYLPMMRDYNHKNKQQWTYAGERQLFEMLFEYCIKKNIDINQTIREIISEKQAYYLLSRHYHLINH